MTTTKMDKVQILLNHMDCTHQPNSNEACGKDEILRIVAELEAESRKYCFNDCHELLRRMARVIRDDCLYYMDKEKVLADYDKMNEGEK